MPNLNKVFLMGNLTRDPQTRFTSGGTGLCQFGLAINRRYTTASGEDREDTCFVDIDIWGKQGESCQNYLHKGSPVFVEGRLKFDQWEDRESGQRRSRLTVIGERVQFLGSPGRGGDFGDKGGQSGGGGGDGGGQGQPPPQQQPPQQQQQQQQQQQPPQQQPQQQQQQPQQQQQSPPFPSSDAGAGGDSSVFNVQDENSIDDIPF
jgi:single-strand DNA-binding protein